MDQFESYLQYQSEIKKRTPHCGMALARFGNYIVSAIGCNTKK